MSQAHDRIAQLASRYAADDLEAAERAEVEAHLGSCAECRTLVDTGSLIRDAQAAGPDPMLAHPDARLISRFALHRERMPAEAASFVASHLDGCEACAGAAQLARESAALEERAPERSVEVERAQGPERSTEAAAPSGLWDFLKGSLLRPELAFAYLLLLAVATPFALRSSSSAPAPGPADDRSATEIATLLPSEEVRLAPSDVLRGQHTLADRVRDVPLRDGQQILLIALETDLDPVDWEIVDGAIELSLESGPGDGAATILRKLLQPSDVDEMGTVRVAIPTRLLEPGVEHRVTIRAPESNEPPLFEVLFRPARN